ncbi:MAG: hypothetical protein K9L74_05795 [Candidatus Izimaplasma sp.]|nr:hypothetical protein [Candidatus Izimaplasma bacterium]
MNFLENIPFMDTIAEAIGIETYAQKAYDFFISLSSIEQMVGTVLLAIILLLGVFDLIKKLSKLIIIVGVIVGLWVLYNQGLLDGLIG